MRQEGLYLRAMADEWQVLPLGGGDDAAGVEFGEDAGYCGLLDYQAALRVVDQLGVDRFAARPCRIVIGVPADWCLCATVSSEGLPKGGTSERHQALAFRLESVLPIDFEDHAIGFVGDERRGQVLGIAIQAARLSELVDALEDAGHEVLAIVPRGLLTAQAALDGRSPEVTADCTGMLLQEGRGRGDQFHLTQMLILDHQKAPRWRLVDPDQASLTQQVVLDNGECPKDRRWLVQEGLQDQAEGLSQDRHDRPDIEVIPDPEQQELKGARAVLAGQIEPWSDLRSGPLAPRHQWRRLRTPVLVCVAALIMLLVTASSLLWVRAGQLEDIAHQYDQQAASDFEEVMPGQDVPVSPQRRLQTRLQQLRGEQGLAGGDQEPDTALALELLYQAMAGLPSDQRYAITDLRMEDGRLRIAGHARTHGEADQIANSLRTNTEFLVDPPSTDNLPDQGVRFVINARFNPVKDQAALPQSESTTLAGSGEDRQ